MVDASPAVPGAEELPDAIGDVRMLPDGTLAVWLVLRGPGGLIGDDWFGIAPGGSDRWGNPYQMWLDHVGGLRPGENKLIPPFPDPSLAS